MVHALQIERVVLHGVKRAGKDSSITAELSEAEADLNDRSRIFLQQQVQTSLKHGREIIEEPGLSTLPDTVRSYLNGSSDFLGCSRQLATLLQSSQPAQSPDGLLMVADAVDGTQRVFVVAKLEHERGAQAVREPNAEGQLVYSMNFLDNLFFTTGSKVYKIGYFPIASPGDPLAGKVVDHQAQGHAVAEYFRENYLGCTWKERPELATERFMDAVQRWIDGVEDPIKRSRYQVALISELQSNNGTLSTTGFAQTHLDVGDQGDFTREVGKTAVPSSTFSKDLTLVRARLENVRIDTATGVVVIARPESMENGTVTVEDEANGVSRITVLDQLSKTSGYGRLRGA
jgi:hypothetical protein